VDPISRYQKSICWQKHIREQNYESDLIKSGLSKIHTDCLSISDFEFKYVPKVDKLNCKLVKEFIEKHEWLGKMPNRPTHRFIATYEGIVAGVLVMGTPNAFSYLLGKPNLNLEKQISRGACISWSPTNLGSWLIMNSIRWMIKNTEFRYFTSYSDTAAKELGTIYQACNFTYLGKTSGSRYEFYDPENPQRGWFSSRLFRKVGQYKKYSLNLGLQWQDSWTDGCKMVWNNMPSIYHAQLAQASRDYQARCEHRKVQPKHKYVYIKGRNKTETKKLLKAFSENSPKLLDLPYPKIRGQ
jgi:hypothetical protein